MKKSLLLGVLAAILLLGAASYAAAADTVTVTKTGTGVTTAQTATDTVTAKAFVNSKLILTVATPVAPQTVDFGNVDPGTAYGPQAVNLTVSSNKLYNITVTKAGDTVIGLTTTLANSTNNAKTASQSFTDNYSINVPWTTDPGAYTATVQYSVVQQ